MNNGHYLGLQQILLFLYLAYDLVAITSEVAASGRAVFLPRLQAHPAEVIFALRTQNDSVSTTRLSSK